MKKLTETSRCTEVTATAKDKDYEYEVNYRFFDGNIVNLQCTVIKVTTTEDTGEKRTYVGSMSLSGDNKSTNFPANEEVAAHVAMFEAIIAEVKEEIEA
ncbi:MAG: hypothetical protein IKS70_02010 [Bacteroides sp.]|nr:hypothetical protein [Bacteroides sp.]